MRFSTTPQHFAELGTATTEKPYFPLIHWDIHQLTAEKASGLCQLPARSAHHPGAGNNPGALSRCQGFGWSWLCLGAYGMPR